IYFPNANHELSRLGFKIKFADKLLSYLKKLENLPAGRHGGKPLIVTGDYNVAHNEIDLARPKANVGNPGFTDEERNWMTKFLSKNFKDIFRELHPNKVQYSWWSYRANARANNVGWRIDYFCVSDKILKKVSKAFILDKVTGSDHAPVGIEIKN
ncbi:endonuclease/exonuclease/phosphatase family protein, partial [bacterium]|nr:endonuclease/exonuclease/phosphatase family protein [bacterium]